jgi:hypothetical protein
MDMSKGLVKTLGGALAGLGMVACGGPGTVEGTVAGNALEVKSALTVSEGGVRNNIIFLSDKEGRCESALGGRRPKNETALGIALVRYDFSTTPPSYLPIAPGDYRVQTDSNFSTNWTQYAVVEFGNGDANCEEMLSSDLRRAVSGLVTIASIDSSGGITSGSFDLTIGKQGDRLTGSFDATACAAPSGGNSCE